MPIEEIHSEIQKLKQEHASVLLLEPWRAPAFFQKLNMDQNEHLQNEIKKLNKILADFQKLKDENDDLKAENEDLKKEIAELKPAVPGSAAVAGSAAGGQW